MEQIQVYRMLILKTFAPRAFYHYHNIQNYSMLSPSPKMAGFTSFSFTVSTTSGHFFLLGACYFLQPISLIRASTCFFQVAFDLLLFLLSVTSKFNASFRCYLSLFAKRVRTISQLPLLPFFQ